jgi:hypothetical protein
MIPRRQLNVCAALLLAASLWLGPPAFAAQEDQSPKPAATQPQGSTQPASTPAPDEQKAAAPVPTGQAAAAQRSEPAPAEESTSAPETSKCSVGPPTSPKPKRETGKSSSIAPRSKRHSKTRQSMLHVETPTQPGKVVVRNGGARDDTVQLLPGGSQEQNAHGRENADQLVAATEQNLKKLSARQLTSSQQSTLEQIQTYLRQARSAADAGDFSRANTLAYKARLLSDELSK